MTNTSINRTFLIILLGILAALGPFSIDMYLPGFKQIAANFNTTEQRVAFTLTSYFVGIALGQLIYGPIVDKYGRKKPLLAGLTIYVVASIGIALSTNIELMISLRFLQALGGCVGMVSSNAIITDVYERERTAKAFSMIMLVMGIAPLIAPSVGSILLESSGWSIIFYFLAVFATIVILLIYLFLPETSKYMHKNPLKINEITQNYWLVLKNKAFLYNTLAGSISMAILFTYISSSSFVFLTIYGLAAKTFALLFAVNAFGLISGSYINGILSTRFDAQKIARTASWILMLLTSVLFLTFHYFPTIHYYGAVASLFSTLFLVGFINPNATAASLAPFSHKAGTASALGGSIRMGAGATAAAMVGIFQSQTVSTMFGMIAFNAVLVFIFLQLAKRDKQTFKK